MTIKKLLRRIAKRGLRRALNPIYLVENRVNWHPLLTKHLVDKNVFAETFLLLDVGASGGIGGQWRSFAPHLQAFAFDPLIKEVERLNQIESDKKVQYLPYYVVSENKEIDDYKATEAADVYGRSSADQFTKIFNFDYSKEVFNSGQEMVYTDKSISLDRFCSEKGIKKVDFIKTDTDGWDYKVLRGAKQLIQDQNLLGLCVECNFNGNFHPYSNAFRNIDFLLVEAGFNLFSLSVSTYTKKDLPGRFLYDIPAQTVSGQPSQGDAVYLRDLAKLKKEGKEIPTSQVVKMICVQEVLGLPDCAAELLNVFRSQLEQVVDVDRCLDLLAKDMNIYSTYQQHIDGFNRQAPHFYASKLWS